MREQSVETIYDDGDFIVIVSDDSYEYTNNRGYHYSFTIYKRVDTTPTGLTAVCRFHSEKCSAVSIVKERIGSFILAACLVGRYEISDLPATIVPIMLRDIAEILKIIRF